MNAKHYKAIAKIKTSAYTRITFEHILSHVVISEPPPEWGRKGKWKLIPFEGKRRTARVKARTKERQFFLVYNGFFVFVAIVYIVISCVHFTGQEPLFIELYVPVPEQKKAATRKKHENKLKRMHSHRFHNLQTNGWQHFYYFFRFSFVLCIKQQ